MLRPRQLSSSGRPPPCLAPYHPPPSEVEGPSPWSLLRGEQSQPSFYPFQPSSCLRPLPQDRGKEAELAPRVHTMPRPIPPRSLLPPVWGALGGSCVTSCTKTFLKPLFRDFCPAGWGGGGCLPCQGSCCGQNIWGAGDICSICWLLGAPHSLPRTWELTLQRGLGPSQAPL